MVAKILDDNNEELKQGRRRKQRERQKSDRFSKNFARASRFFLATFLSRRYTTATWNFLISRARSMESVNRVQKFSFSFSKLRYGPFREFCQHLTHSDE